MVISFKFSLTRALHCSYIFIQFNLKYCGPVLEEVITMQIMTQDDYEEEDNSQMKDDTDLDDN